MKKENAKYLKTPRNTKTVMHQLVFHVTKYGQKHLLEKKKLKK